MRDKVSANPKLFDPDVQERTDEAIPHADDVPRSTRVQPIGGVEQNVNAPSCFVVVSTNQAFTFVESAQEADINVTTRAKG